MSAKKTISIIATIAVPAAVTLNGLAYELGLNGGGAVLSVKTVVGREHDATAIYSLSAKELKAIDYITGTAAGKAPILPTRVVVSGVRFDMPTAATTGTCNFGEEFEESLIPVVWDMNSFKPADYAVDKIGTSFEVRGATAVRSRAPGLPVKAIVRVNRRLAAPDYNHSVTSENVIFDDVFWRPKQLVNAGATIDHAINMLESTSANRYAVQNFKNAATRLMAIAGGDTNPNSTTYNGYVFQDTDVYKTLEGFAYNLAAVWGDQTVTIARKRQLQNKLGEWIRLIEAVQYADGYITTTFSSRSETTAGGDGDSLHRWRHFTRHEMYNIGHFIEAAVAYTRYSVGTKQNDHRLYEAGKRAADHIVAFFGPGGKRVEVPGHQEIELAMMKMAALVEEYEGAGTGQKYRDTVETLINRRGRATGDYARPSGYHGMSYSQDATPLVNETRAVGHAVRAMYYYTGATDVAITLPSSSPNKAAFLTGINNIYSTVTERNNYITGGLGSGETSEGFGEDWRLRNSGAYTETCAAIAGANWYQRLNLYYEDAKYADSYERALYNGALVGVSLNGTHFYYACHLDSAAHPRSAWFGCACCPPNLIRTIANMGGYMYTVNKDKVFVNMYGGSTGNINVGGDNVIIRQETNYPWEGAVKMTVTPPAAKNFMLNLRIPGWIKAQKYQQVTITVDGAEINAAPSDKGYVSITKNWPAKGTVIEINMPMEVRFTEADDNVSRVYGDFGTGIASNGQSNKVAIERGPIVYQLETPGVPATDAIGKDARMAFIPRDMEYKATWRPNLLRGVVEVTGHARYETSTGERNQFIQLTPYHAKNNRGNDPSNLGSSNSNPNNCESARVWINATEMGVQIRGDKNKLHVGGFAKLTANPKVNYDDRNVPKNFEWTVLSGNEAIVMLDSPARGQTDDSGPGKIGGLNFTRPASIATYRAIKAGAAVVQVSMKDASGAVLATDTYEILVTDQKTNANF
jgi:DUF1680 family protein